jgi:succinate dehydrogenase / fumarate reductase membrane anchor subunit
MKLVASLRALTGLGDAAGGTDHWWGQRITGVALVILGLWFAASVVVLPSLEHSVVVEFTSRPLNRVLLSLLCLVAAYHSYLGVQVVIDDYVHVAKLNQVSMIVSGIGHLVVAAVAIYAIFEIGAGA